MCLVKEEKMADKLKAIIVGVLDKETVHLLITSIHARNRHKYAPHISAKIASYDCDEEGVVIGNSIHEKDILGKMVDCFIIGSSDFEIVCRMRAMP